MFRDAPAGASGIRFKTFSGVVPMSALSLGYKTTLAWTLDLRVAPDVALPVEATIRSQSPRWF